MRKMIQRPDVQEKIRQHLHSTSNPFRHPEAQRRGHMRLQEIGYPMLNGGNGRGPTKPQLMLAERLQWPMEWTVPTRQPKNSGYPTHYKLDIADPYLQIAIEVDGVSHQTPQIKERDDRKDAFLMGIGWTVLRFWNREILENLDRVVSVVQSTISKQARATISPMASSSTTATA